MSLNLSCWLNQGFVSVLAFLSFEESLQCIKIIISQMYRLPQFLVNAVCNNCVYTALHTVVVFLG